MINFDDEKMIKITDCEIGSNRDDLYDNDECKRIHCSNYDHCHKLIQAAQDAYRDWLNEPCTEHVYGKSGMPCANIRIDCLKCRRKAGLK